jgi:hypothetical protein
MEERIRFIDPKRFGIWISIAFGVAVLALVMALFGLRESRVGTALTQLEVVKLSDRIKAVEQTQGGRTAPARKR